MKEGLGPAARTQRIGASGPFPSNGMHTRSDGLKILQQLQGQEMVKAGFHERRACKAASVKVETIRYCERIGLLPRPAGNHRAYGADLVG